jgi:hypothetical protein
VADDNTHAHILAVTLDLSCDPYRSAQSIVSWDHHGNPPGDEAENLLNFIPQHRVEDVIYFAPQDHERPVTFNPVGGKVSPTPIAPYRP